MISFKVGPNGKLPTRGSDGAAGLDLYYSGEDVYIMGGARQVFDTDVCVAIPEGWVGLVKPRSGLAFRDGLDTMAGVIDADYRGEIKVLIINHGIGKTIKHMERIAQLVVVPYHNGPMQQVDDLGDTTRGDGGFGSTGV